MNLNLINLKVDDWGTMLAFYQDVLGMKPVVLEHDHKYGWLDAGSVRLSIYEKKDLPTAENERLSLQFEVQNIEDEVKRLEALGCHFTDKQLATGEAYKLATFTDPEGNPISIYELKG